MNEREEIIQLWFEMWLKQQDLGIDHIFTEDVIYTESWSPQYRSREAVKHWFEEWNTRGRVAVWDIKQFFHKENQTVAEWYFKNEMASGKTEAIFSINYTNSELENNAFDATATNSGKTEEFDGISLVEWTAENQIKSLKEFGCNRSNYNPYESGDTPRFRDQQTNWF